MKGATVLATLQRLGIVPSFSLPSVSNDNAQIERMFRTLKYAPSYPSRPFDSLHAAREWIHGFVHWYNETYRHSAIRFVTPAQRHRREDGVHPRPASSRLRGRQTTHARTVEWQHPGLEPRRRRLAQPRPAAGRGNRYGNERPGSLAKTTTTLTINAVDGDQVLVTARFEVAARAPESTSFEVLIGRADRCLYRAKAEGRNRIVACRPGEGGKSAGCSSAGGETVV